MLAFSKGRPTLDLAWPRSAKATWIWTGAVLALALVFMWLSLHDVSGATTSPDGGCCQTEFVHAGCSLAPTLLIVPIYGIARSSRRLPLVIAVLLASASVLVIAHVAVTRTQDAGWGDGLENFSYLESVVQIGLFVLAAAVGVVAGTRRRARRVTMHDRPMPS